MTPELAAEIRREQERLLERMIELGWATRSIINENTNRWRVDWTPQGAERLRLLREIKASLGYRGFPTWIALDALAHSVLMGQ